MKRTLFTVVFDTLFFFIVGFLLSLTLTRTFSSYPYSVILAVLISAFFSVFIFAFLKRKRVKKYGLKIDQKTLENTLLTMSVLDKDAIYNLFFSAYKSLGENPRTVNSYIQLLNGDKVFIFFSPDGLKKSNVVRAYNLLESNKKGTIYYYKSDLDTLTFAKRFKRLKLVDGNSSYVFLTKNKVAVQPNEEILEVNSRSKLSDLFIKKHAVKHFVFGVSFYLLSFISLLKTYYLISGTLFLIFSVLSILFGKSKEELS
jgi:hypothetical protein